MAQNTFYAFDLPDCTLDYDGRRTELAEILGADSEQCKIDGAELLSVGTSTAGIRLVASYTVGRFPQIYEALRGQSAEGVLIKRRRSVYAKHHRPGVESRDWLKRRFEWD